MSNVNTCINRLIKINIPDVWVEGSVDDTRNSVYTPMYLFRFSKDGEIKPGFYHDVQNKIGMIMNVELIDTKKIDDEEYNLNMYYVYCDNESFYLKADQFTYL